MSFAGVRDEPSRYDLQDDWLGDLEDWIYGGRQDTSPFEWLDWTRARPSVGPRSNIPVIVIPNITPTIPGIPTLVPGPATQPPDEVLTTTPGGEEPPNQIDVPIATNQEVDGMPVSWGDYAASGGVLPSDWNQYPMASDHPSVAIQTDTIVSSGDDDMGILGDIYDTIDTGLGGVLPGGVPYTGPGSTPTAPVVYTTAPNVLPPGTPSTPAVTTIPGTGGPVVASCGTPMIYNSATGKWSKKRKRRRRQLATKSDLRDLASLKGVLGQGKAFEVWIATHS